MWRAGRVQGGTLQVGKMIFFSMSSDVTVFSNVYPVNYRL